MTYCRCQPREDQDRLEVEVAAPEWTGRDTIGLDACIVDAVQMLWDHGHATLSSCCGHNRAKPSLVIPADADVDKVVALLEEHDGRPWQIMRWELVVVGEVSAKGDQS